MKSYKFIEILFLGFTNYREHKPSLKALLCGHKLEAHIYMERIPIEQIPKDEKDCEKWMYDIFEKKVIINFINFIINIYIYIICIIYIINIMLYFHT